MWKVSWNEGGDNVDPLEKKQEFFNSEVDGARRFAEVLELAQDESRSPLVWNVEFWKKII